METYTLCGSQLHKDIRLLQADGIIARTDRLVGMRELGILSAAMSHRQESDIAQVANARTAQVRMAEAYEHGVADVIAGAPVPAVGILRRTDLYQSEGHVGSKEHMTMSTRSDPGIHIVRKLAAMLAGICCHHLTCRQQHHGNE